MLDIDENKEILKKIKDEEKDLEILEKALKQNKRNAKIVSTLSRILISLMLVAVYNYIEDRIPINMFTMFISFSILPHAKWYLDDLKELNEEIEFHIKSINIIKKYRENEIARNIAEAFSETLKAELENTDNKEITDEQTKQIIEDVIKEEQPVIDNGLYSKIMSPRNAEENNEMITRDNFDNIVNNGNTLKRSLVKKY